jgi:hypothetical protein
MDGQILKPTHPAMSIDSTFIQRAFGSGGPQGQFAAAFTEVELKLIIILLLCTECK